LRTSAQTRDETREHFRGVNGSIRCTRVRVTGFLATTGE
jgi:hypothetical protein